MPYRFHIPYLGIDVALLDTEFEYVGKYARREIGFREYYKFMREKLIMQLIPRGYFKSVSMYLVALYERGEYTYYTHEDCAEIELEWYIKTYYIERKGHYFITEGRAEIFLQIPLVCWDTRKKEILDEGNDILEYYYVDGWTKEYYFIPQSEIKRDFEKAVVTRVKVVTPPITTCDIYTELISFETGLKRSLEAVIIWDRDLSRRIARYIEDGLKEFENKIKEICGGVEREV